MNVKGKELKIKAKALEMRMKNQRKIALINGKHSTKTGEI